jgi:ABC-type bacteriocin/lantibiotic exporter with double-glycine peptidase domain
MQFDSSDCGVACASSICAYYGKDIGLSRIRELIKAGGLYAEMWKNQVGKE